jgi:hypothetical protein
MEILADKFLRALGALFLGEQNEVWSQFIHFCTSCRDFCHISGLDGERFSG